MLDILPFGIFIKNTGVPFDLQLKYSGELKHILGTRYDRDGLLDLRSGNRLFIVKIKFLEQGFHLWRNGPIIQI